jgi:hypothetical protein
MPKTTRLLLVISAICFVFYGYYQVEFLQQPSWISDEAFRLQDIYFKWAGAAFASGWGGVLWWRITV